MGLDILKAQSMYYVRIFDQNDQFPQNVIQNNKYNYLRNDLELLRYGK